MDYAKINTKVKTKTIIVEILDATIGMLLVIATLVLSGGILYMLK